jgi:hypothetical protein
VKGDIEVSGLVVDKLFTGVDVIFGMDIITKLGGVFVQANRAEFVGTVDGEHCRGIVANVCEKSANDEKYKMSIVDEDFTAWFNGKVWTVKWVWKEWPIKLKNKIDCYSSVESSDTKDGYRQEIARWIAEGCLRPWNGDIGGIIPLMAVSQPNKAKVRPVLDFRELNNFVSCHSEMDAAVCDETIRAWRQKSEPLKILDLRSAYLQIHVDRSLWPYQLVRHEGKVYSLTRLGFGLNCAPRIMTKILKYVLSLDDRVSRGTDSYLDDIIVDESVVTADEVAAHLGRYGLQAKPSEDLDGGRVLGLKLHRTTDNLLAFKRGGEIPEVNANEKLSRRQLFSIFGKLVGHYPVCGWLRVACSYIKRLSEGKSWDDYVGDECGLKILEVVERVIKDDPVRGQWSVLNTSKNGKVWCDASTLAIGCAVEINGQIVEDASWLRKKDDDGHINVAELNAVIKGVNMALKWGLESLEIMTDSATVISWLKSALLGAKRVKVSGMSELLVRRRLGLLRETVDEFKLSVAVTFVESCKNRADILTRVPKFWLKREANRCNQSDVLVDPYCSSTNSDEHCAISVQDLHCAHHFGVDRTLYLAKLADSTVEADEVRDCVRNCMRCLSIDPSPEQHIEGVLSVAENWVRLAMDVTHYGGKAYMTLIDCGPSRFAVWREVRSENACDISRNMDEIFRERGPPSQILLDNSTTFRSRAVLDVSQKWNVCLRFRAAYRPSGNGIVERHHRTIKRMAARSEGSPLDAVFWYNLAAKRAQDASSAPCKEVHTYEWRHPAVKPTLNEDMDGVSLKVGDAVFVKPGNSTCTTNWTKGEVTGVTSRNNVSVDGIPRHVLDVRRIPPSPSNTSENITLAPSDNFKCNSDVLQILLEDSDSEILEGQEDRREAESERSRVEATRIRKPPVWLNDYVV